MDEENTDSGDDLLTLEQEEDDGSISGDLSEEASQGFYSPDLEGFSFPGDEKDWN